LTLAQIDDQYDVGRANLTRAAKRPEGDPNRLPSRKVGRSVLVEPKDAKAWCENFLARREVRTVARLGGENKLKIKEALRQLRQKAPKRRN
jgi:hypothetical protein